MTSGALDGPRTWSLPTYISDPGALDGPTLRLAGDEGHHAARAARARPGELVRLIDGRGTEAAAAVRSVSGDVVDLEIVERRAHDRSDGVELIVGQAVLKGRDFDEPVRRLAELGASLVVPLVTERVVPRIDADRVAERRERWRSVALSATKQSRGVFPTAIGELATLGAFAEATRDAHLRFVAWEEGGVGLRGLVADVAAPSRVACVIGPEGGLTADEVEELEAAGFLRASLGRRILRADWAAAAVAAVVAAEVGGLLP
jgi:16S rRNA (uracil1498-N3)-methyltransferase